MRNGRGCRRRLRVFREKLRMRRGVRDYRWEEYGEGRSLAGLAGHLNVSAHHLAELAADRQAQPGAAKLAACGSVGLGEGLEELAELLRGHADAGVADRK